MPACQRSSHSEARLLVPELGLRAEAGGMGCVLITAVDFVHTVVEGVAVGVGAGPLRMHDNHFFISSPDMYRPARSLLSCAPARSCVDKKLPGPIVRRQEKLPSQIVRGLEIASQIVHPLTKRGPTHSHLSAHVLEVITLFFKPVYTVARHKKTRAATSC